MLSRRVATALAIAVIAGAGTAAAVALSSGGSPAGPRTAVLGGPGPSAPPHRAAPVVHDGPPGTESVPILMYHVIQAAPPGAPFPGLYVIAADFAAQMHALAAAGYHAVTMNEVWENWRHGAPLPKGKPIVISFDNGYASQFTAALPVLRSMGWVGVENLQLSGLPPSQGGLSRRQVRLMIRDGWELDTQGYSHADLITLDAAQLRFQVAVARRRLRERYHVAVDWFCYPSGHYDASVIAAVRAAGFRGSTTVTKGWASPREDPYTLPRLEVLAGTSPATLVDEIAAIAGNAPPGPHYP